jgi:hypothetical protein
LSGMETVESDRTGVFQTIGSILLWVLLVPFILIILILGMWIMIVEYVMEAIVVVVLFVVVGFMTLLAHIVHFFFGAG